MCFLIASNVKILTIPLKCPKTLEIIDSIKIDKITKVFIFQYICSYQILTRSLSEYNKKTLVFL